MCVIFIADQERPTEEMVRLAYETNPAGAGIAYREGGFVKWKKGLDLNDIQDMCKTVPMPFVAHFRIPTVGGRKDALCHPFPITKNVELALEGKTKDFVLFHNGHWNSWKHDTKEAAITTGTPIPPGRWSDTRAMAFNAYIFGLGILEFIDEKAVAFGPDKIEVFPGQGWVVKNKVWCSNTNWERTTHSNWRGTADNTQRLCKFSTCKAYRHMQLEYCWEHRHIGIKNVNETFDDTEELPVVSSTTKGTGEAGAGEAKEAVVLGPTERALLPVTYGAGVTPEMLADMGVPGSEVLTGETPFELATRLFKDNKLSKNKWKKYRKEYEQEERERRTNNGSAVVPFLKMTEPPVIIH